MKVPNVLKSVPDAALLAAKSRVDRLRSGTMASFPHAVRFTFGTRKQTGAATIVLGGAGRKIVFRIRSRHAAKVRVFVYPTPHSSWTFDVIALDGADAALEFYVFGAAGGAMTFTRGVDIGADAGVTLSTVFLRGGKTDISDHARMHGERGTFRSETLAVASGTDAIDAVQHVSHQAKNTTSELVNSLVAGDAATLRFDVTGAIAKGHAGSNCRQQNRGVLLGEKAQIAVAPKLLIDEFDVQAGHGCAIGRVNADELYYLSSRGLDETTAKRLIVSGYTAPFVQKLADPTIRRHVEAALIRKLGGAS